MFLLIISGLDLSTLYIRPLGAHPKFGLLPYADRQIKGHFHLYQSYKSTEITVCLIENVYIDSIMMAPVGPLVVTHCHASHTPQEDLRKNIANLWLGTHIGESHYGSPRNK